MTRDVHEYFGLTYAQYKVLDRTLMQSMPEEWQEKFVELLEQFDDATPEEFQTEYKVVTGTWSYCEDLDPAELRRMGFTYNRAGDEWFGPDGRLATRAFCHGPNPVPPYGRGRTRVEMEIDDA